METIEVATPAEAPSIMAKQAVYAHFPAWCIPTLAAWQGTGPLTYPHVQKDFTGARIQESDTEGRVVLTATDGSNFLYLDVEGHCLDGPFAFCLPPELVAACKAPPPVEMFIEGSKPLAMPEPWRVPKTVLLTGALYGTPNRSLTSLGGFVQGVEPPPDGDAEWSLWGGEVGFNEFSSIPDPIVALTLAEACTRPVTTPIVDHVFGMLSKTARPGVGVMATEGGTAHLWKFGESFALTCFAKDGGG